MNNKFESFMNAKDKTKEKNYLSLMKETPVAVKNKSQKLLSLLADSVIWTFEKLFIDIPCFIGDTVIQVFNNVSRVINIKIGFFNAEKIELCEQIQKLREENAELRLDMEAIDADNYLFFNSNRELVSAGIHMHDELIALYGESNYFVLRWKHAESLAKVKLGLDYEESSKYLSVRQRRSLQEFVPAEYPISEAFFKGTQFKSSKLKTTKAKKTAKKKRNKA